MDDLGEDDGWLLSGLQPQPHQPPGALDSLDSMLDLAGWARFDTPPPPLPPAPAASRTLPAYSDSVNSSRSLSEGGFSDSSLSSAYASPSDPLGSSASSSSSPASSYSLDSSGSSSTQQQQRSLSKQPQQLQRDSRRLPAAVREEASRPLSSHGSWMSRTASPPSSDFTSPRSLSSLSSAATSAPVSPLVTAGDRAALLFSHGSAAAAAAGDGLSATPIFSSSRTSPALSSSGLASFAARAPLELPTTAAAAAVLPASSAALDSAARRERKESSIRKTRKSSSDGPAAAQRAAAAAGLPSFPFPLSSAPAAVVAASLLPPAAPGSPALPCSAPVGFSPPPGSKRRATRKFGVMIDVPIKPSAAASPPRRKASRLLHSAALAHQQQHAAAHSHSLLAAASPSSDPGPSFEPSAVQQAVVATISPLMRQRSAAVPVVSALELGPVDSTAAAAAARQHSAYLAAAANAAFSSLPPVPAVDRSPLSQSRARFASISQSQHCLPYDFGYSRNDSQLSALPSQPEIAGGGRSASLPPCLPLDELSAARDEAMRFTAPSDQPMQQQALTHDALHFQRQMSAPAVVADLRGASPLSAARHVLTAQSNADRTAAITASFPRAYNQPHSRQQQQQQQQLVQPLSRSHQQQPQQLQVRQPAEDQFAFPQLRSDFPQSPHSEDGHRRAYSPPAHQHPQRSGPASAPQSSQYGPPAMSGYGEGRYLDDATSTAVLSTLAASLSQLHRTASAPAPPSQQQQLLQQQLAMARQRTNGGDDADQRPAQPTAGGSSSSHSLLDGLNPQLLAARQAQLTQHFKQANSALQNLSPDATAILAALSARMGQQAAEQGGAPPASNGQLPSSRPGFPPSPVMLPSSSHSSSPSLSGTRPPSSASSTSSSPAPSLQQTAERQLRQLQAQIIAQQNQLQHRLQQERDRAAAAQQQHRQQQQGAALFNTPQRQQQYSSHAASSGNGLTACPMASSGCPERFASLPELQHHYVLRHFGN